MKNFKFTIFRKNLSIDRKQTLAKERRIMTVKSVIFCVKC